PRLIEVGSGDWTGRQLDELSSDPGWNRYNSFRSSTRAPGGELMTDIASRVVDEMEELRHRHPNQSVALFSHGDVIKVAVAQYAGIAFDLMHRLEISPASISIIQLADWGCRILAVNMTSQP
ncbi:MAG TPA: histidine phosphatase family protein, partial [Bryobacteraceae bacterium]|nr:histidine phosphatase family protein [Bryobacteraceae bacterium]